MKKMLSWIGTLLIIALAAGCGDAVPASEKIDNAIQKSTDIETFHTEFDLALTTKTEAGPEGVKEDRIALRGGADVDRREGLRAKGRVSIDGIEGAVRLLFGQEAGGQNLSLLTAFIQNVEFVIVEDKSYVNLQGGWYDAGTMIQDLMSTFSLGLEAGLMKDSCFLDALRDPAKLGSDELLKDLEELPSEKIDGKDTQHFKAGIDWEKALDRLGNVLRECDRPESAAAVETLKQDIQETFRVSELELWIDSDDVLRRSELSLELLPGALTSIIGLAPQAQLLTFTQTSTISRVGEDFKIDRPEGEIKPISEILTLLEGIFGRPIDLGGAGGTNPFAR